MSVGGGSVECDTLHGPVIERGTIDGGCKAWLVAHTLWTDAAGGQFVGQDLFDHRAVDGHHDAVGDGKLIHLAQPTGEAHAVPRTVPAGQTYQDSFRYTSWVRGTQAPQK